MSTLAWKPGSHGNERLVRCAGCGGTYAVAECSVAKLANTHVFACSPHCEQDFEDLRRERQDRRDGAA